MPSLTIKQQKFVDYYLELGNGTEAAKRAGYSAKTAGMIAAENLKKPYIREYIEFRLAEMEEKRIAKADEVLKFYTSVMRGEEKDQFGLDASLDTRIKAATELMKRYANANERNKTALEKLDKLFEEFKNAVESETG